MMQGAGREQGPPPESAVEAIEASQESAEMVLEHSPVEPHASAAEEAIESGDVGEPDEEVEAAGEEGEAAIDGEGAPKKRRRRRGGRRHRRRRSGGGEGGGGEQGGGEAPSEPQPPAVQAPVSRGYERG